MSSSRLALENHGGRHFICLTDREMIQGPPSNISDRKRAGDDLDPVWRVARATRQMILARTAPNLLKLPRRGKNPNR